MSMNPSQSSGAPSEGADSGNADRHAPIVCIGASAGGLEALQDFLKPMHPDVGAAFVVVTHQHPGQASLLPELLAKTTQLPVSPATNGTRVQPNHVYVGMPGSMLELAGGRLCHAAPAENGDRPIDHFMRFLAADQGEHSVGVILSGAGSDGTLGIKAIKAAGGMVMAQQPTTAKYDSMPSSAIATGLADYVLNADQMAGALQDYLRGSYLKRARNTAGAIPLLPDEEMTRILLRLREHTGHDFTGYKRSTLSRRIERRMSVHHIDQPADYLSFLHATPHEAQLLMQELLISVTSFFRDPHAFQSLAEKALPALFAARAPNAPPLRVWVPGCATGEEAYSITMLLHEQMTRANLAPNVQVFGTDLDGHAINVARAGLYPEGIVADVSAERLERYFTRENGSYRVRQMIRESLVFAVQNLLRDPPFTKLDLIVCRNVLIYLTADVQRRLLPVFHFALQPGGLFFLGSSETIGGLGTLFETIDTKWKIHRRKELATAILPLTTPLSANPGLPAAATAPAARAAQSGMASTVQRMLIARFAPPSLVVDALGNIVYVQGHTGTYLEMAEGQPSSNLLQLAREGLAPALATALRQAQAKNREIVRAGVRVRTNHTVTRADVTVRPIHEPESLRGLLLVTIQPAAERDAAPKAAPPDKGSSSTHEEALEAELDDTRKSLQTTIEDLANSNEELRTSNEELQSTNEELQSTNEELETSKEELQSLNEELNTVNAELQSKVESIAQSSNDLRNLLNSTQVACVFLDEELRVKRFTQKAKELIRLIDSDVGRPLGDLSTNLLDDHLESDCRSVLDTLVPLEREVRDTAGHWHLLRVLPYRTGESSIDGVVATLINIDRVKEAERQQSEAADSRDLFESIVQTAREPLVVLGAENRIILANSAFYQTFHACKEDVEGRIFFQLANGQWDLPPLRDLLERVLPEQATVADYKVTLTFPNIGVKSFVLNARCLRRKDGRPDMILLAMEEVTEHPL